MKIPNAKPNIRYKLADLHTLHQVHTYSNYLGNTEKLYSGHKLIVVVLFRTEAACMHASQCKHNDARHIRTGRPATGSVRPDDEALLALVELAGAGVEVLLDPGDLAHDDAVAVVLTLVVAVVVAAAGA